MSLTGPLVTEEKEEEGGRDEREEEGRREGR